MPTAEDDFEPVSHGEFKLPRALLNWETPSQRSAAVWVQRGALDSQPTPVSRPAPFAGTLAEAHASSEAFDDEPTVAIPFVPHAFDRPGAPQSLPERETAHLDATLTRAVRLWRHRPLRTAAIVAGIALVTCLAVNGARHRSDKSSQTIVSPAVAVRAMKPIVVQLSEARQPGDTIAAQQRGKRTDTSGTRSVARRAHEPPVASVPASKDSGDRAIAPSHAKSGPAERSSTSVTSGSAALPAWGAEAVRDFSGAKSSKAATATTGSQALAAKPASASPDTLPTVAASPLGAREESKPAPAVTPELTEPPEPVAPLRPSTPLTMEQMLNQVEEAAQADRKKNGLKAPTSSERDAELDALINGAMKKK